MNTKRILNTVLAAALTLSLAACGSTQESSGAASTPSGTQSAAGDTSSRTESAFSSASTAQSTPESTESSVQSAPESTSAPQNSENTSYTPPNNGQDGEVSGSILVLPGGRGIMLYGIGYGPGRNYAATVNKYKEKLGANVNVYSMVVPTQVSFYLPEKYFDEGLSDRELPHIDDINDNLSGIIPIDAFSALKGHADEEIYYRTDHHWTQLGAYYAAKAFAETALVPFDELSAYDKHEKSGYIGTLYGSSNENPEIGNNPETFFWYVPKRDYTTTYYNPDMTNEQQGSYFYDPDNFGSTAEWNLTYMAGDGRITHVNTGLNTGRKLMILKDSYADSFAPNLFGSFDDIWVVDMRYCETSAVQLAKDKGITDLLFCSCTFSATAQNQYKLEEIM